MHGTPRKAARCLDEELVHLTEDGPSDGESDRLIIDESHASEGLQAADGSGTSDGEHDADGGWTTVGRNRRRPRPRFRLVLHAGPQSAYQAVTALEDDHPSLKMEVRPNLTGEYTLTPKDDASETLLRRLAEEGDRQLLLDPCVKRHKVVLERYPVNLPLEAVEAHRRVVSTRRLQSGGDAIPTR